MKSRVFEVVMTVAFDEEVTAVQLTKGIADALEGAALPRGQVQLAAKVLERLTPAQLNAMN